MLVLDSAGVQSTVSYRAQAVDAIHDAQTTESLMFEMVSRNLGLAIRCKLWRASTKCFSQIVYKCCCPLQSADALRKTAHS